MRKLFVSTPIILLILFLTACESGNLQDQKVIIYGEIKDYKENNNQKIIDFNFQTLENIKTDIKLVNIDSVGKFQVETSIAWPQDFYFEYGDQRFYLLCSPGDSIKIAIDNSIWDNKKSDKTSCLSIVGGSAKASNIYVNSFLLQTNKLLFKCRSKDIIKSYEAKDYKSFVLSQKKEALIQLQILSDSIKPTSLFESWAKDYINYYSYASLLRYHYRHMAYNGMDIYEFNLPNDFFSVLNDVIMNDKEVISSTHEEFYHEYSAYIDQLLPKDSLEKHWQLYETDIEKYFSNSIKQRSKHSSGFTADVITYEIYSRMLDWSLVKEFEQIYQPEIFNTKYFKNKLEAKFASVKSQFDNPNINKSINFINQNNIHTGILDSINNKYRDKVIYIDFWTRGCGPCFYEMPFSKKLHDDFQEEDVVFLYLALGFKEDAWKAKVSEKQLCGEHMLLSDDQFRILKQKFDIMSFPHYVLVGRNGDIISKNAPRPSNNQIKNEIEKLL